MDTHRSTQKSLVAISFALVYPTLLTWLYFIALKHESAAVQQVTYTLGKLVQFGFPLVWTRFYRPEVISWPRPALAGVIEGLAFGAIVAGGILLAYHFWLAPIGFFEAATEPILEKLTALDLLTPSAFIVLGVFYSLVHSLLEEYYWR